VDGIVSSITYGARSGLLLTVCITVQRNALTRLRFVVKSVGGGQRLTRRELSELLKALGGGVGFVWLFGFAIGYPNDFVPWALFAVWVGLMWASFKLFTK